LNTAVRPSSHEIILTNVIFYSSTPYSLRILIARLAVFPVPNTASTTRIFSKLYF